MAFVSTDCIDKWFTKDSWVYKNFEYLFRNKLWYKSRLPQGFSLCPYFYAMGWKYARGILPSTQSALSLFDCSTLKKEGIAYLGIAKIYFLDTWCLFWYHRIFKDYCGRFYYWNRRCYPTT